MTDNETIARPYATITTPEDEILSALYAIIRACTTQLDALRAHDKTRVL